MKKDEFNFTKQKFEGKYAEFDKNLRDLAAEYGENKETLVKVQESEELQKTEIRNLRKDNKSLMDKRQKILTEN